MTPRGRRGDARGARNLRRGRVRRDDQGCILVVTEGEKTEPSYFDNLRLALGLGLTRVEIVHPSFTDPEGLLREAVRMRDDRRREAKAARRRRDPDAPPEFDEVWIVCDLEAVHSARREQFARARAQSEHEGIRFAHSDPAFEFWLLLHYEFTTAPLSHQDDATARLRRHWSPYAKGAAPPESGDSPRGKWESFLATRLGAAIANAERLHEHHARSGGDGNPSTSADLLARAMNAAADPARQLFQDPLTPPETA